MSRNERSEGGNPPTETREEKTEKTCFMRIIFWCSIFSIMIYAVVTIIFLYVENETVNGTTTLLTSIFTLVSFSVCTYQNV